MKKVIAVVLVLTMALSLVACGGNTTQVEPSSSPTTETPVVETSAPPATETVTETESTEGIEDVPAMETVSFNTLIEYEQKLHELGFTEFKADIWRPSRDSGPACIPTSLTYNDTMFKMEFNYKVENPMTTELEIMEGWTLYGAKNQAAVANISDYKEADYENVDAMDMTEASGDVSGFVHMMDYMMYNLVDGVPEYLLACHAYHYATSQNLYNLVYKHADAMNMNGTVPYILAQSEFDMTMQSVGGTEPLNVESETTVDEVETAVMKIKRGDEIVEYVYEIGMTLIDWSKSSYNVDHWLIFNDGGCYSPDREYYIAPNDIDIGTIATVDGVIQATPAQE